MSHEPSRAQLLADSYASRAAKAALLLAEIERLLAGHAPAEQTELDWEHIFDLGHVTDKLEDAVFRLKYPSARPKEKEKEPQP